jgi:hypothetical protein
MLVMAVAPCCAGRRDGDRKNEDRLTGAEPFRLDDRR